MKKYLPILIILTGFYLFASPSKAFAATCTAASGTVNWNTVGTWDCAHVPAAGDDVVVSNAGTVLTLDVSSNSLGSFNMSNGTFNLSSNTITVDGSSASKQWTVSGGTFNANTSTVVIKDATAYTVTGSVTFNNLTFTDNCGPGSSSPITVASGTTLTVNGTLNFTETTTSCGQGFINGPGTITAKGDITSTLNGFATGATSPLVVTISGTGSQILTGDSSGAFDGAHYGGIPGININKSTGTLFLKQTIGIYGDFTYTLGTVDITTNSNTVNFLSVGGSSTTRTISGSLTLSNVGFADACISPTITMASGTTLTVTGTLTFKGLSSCGAANLNGPGALVAQGNITTTEGGTGYYAGNVAITLS